MNRNSEGYRDSTAGKAMYNVSKEEQRRANRVIQCMKLIAEIGGFEVADCIQLRRKRR